MENIKADVNDSLGRANWVKLKFSYSKFDYWTIRLLDYYTISKHTIRHQI